MSILTNNRGEGIFFLRDMLACTVKTVGVGGETRREIALGAEFDPLLTLIYNYY
jgi:hypothetical protein